MSTLPSEEYDDFEYDDGPDRIGAPEDLDANYYSAAELDDEEADAEGARLPLDEDDLRGDLDPEDA